MVRPTAGSWVVASWAVVFSMMALVGCAEPLLDEIEKKPVAQSAPVTETEPSQPEPPPAPAEPERKGVFGKTTAEVVNAKEYLAQPNIEVADGKIEGVDPFSQAASSYFVLSAKASTLGLQQAVNIHKALHERPPTYDEFMAMMQEHNVEFVKLRSYEKYGYDEEKGTILVLVDTELRDNR
ncbi:MAG: hypothetical protein WEE51_12525 [Pirellulaceae bacterium]